MKCRRDIDQVDGAVRFDFSNGHALAFFLKSVSAGMLTRLMLHGASQKIGDSYSGVQSPDEAWDSAMDVFCCLRRGEWERPRHSDIADGLVLRALTRVLGRSIDETYWLGMDENVRDSVRHHVDIRVAVAEIQAERAREAVTSAGAGLLSERRKLADKYVDVSDKVVGIKFVNGQQIRLKLEDVDEGTKRQLALHGASQKIGDSFSGIKDPCRAREQASAVIDALYRGDWSTDHAKASSSISPRYLSELGQLMAWPEDVTRRALASNGSDASDLFPLASSTVHLRKAQHEIQGNLPVTPALAARVLEVAISKLWISPPQRDSVSAAPPPPA